jgi:hypothetical protein
MNKRIIPLRSKTFLVIAILIITIIFGTFYHFGMWSSIKDFNELSLKNILISFLIVILTFGIGLVITTYVDKDTLPNSDFKLFHRKINVLSRRINKMALSNTAGGIDIETVKDIVKEIWENEKVNQPDIPIDKWDEKEKYKLIEQQTEAFQSDINIQIKRSSKTGLVNLSIGLSLTIIAIFILSSILINPNPTITKDSGLTTLNQYLIYFIPRVTLVLFIEIFSFFFLKLYRNSHNDVKFFYNEKTNIDAKCLAIKLALLHRDSKTLNVLVLELARIERNAVLKKGETTLELEKLKIESATNTELLSKFASFAGFFQEKKIK